MAAPLQRTLHGERITTHVQGTLCSINDRLGQSGAYYFDMDGSGPKAPRTDALDLDGLYLFQPWVTNGDLDVPLLGLADGLDLDGATVDVTLEKDITQFLMPFFSSAIDPAYSTLDNHLNQWTGRLALTYVYEALGPNPVPAPGTLWLCVAALAAGRSMRARQGTGRPPAEPARTAG